MSFNEWPVQDAKARFSELLETCVNEGPQVITKRGTETAVLVSIEEWRRVSSGAARSIKEVLLSDDYFRGDVPLPDRKRAKSGRKPPEFD